MKVMVKCSNCGEKHYIREWSLREARRIKRIYKKGSYTCGKCLGYKLEPYTGILYSKYVT